MAQIERSNRLLLEKMTNIMNTSSGVSKPTPTPSYAPKTKNHGRSLNFDKRQKELLRIHQENKVCIEICDISV